MPLTLQAEFLAQSETSVIKPKDYDWVIATKMSCLQVTMRTSVVQALRRFYVTGLAMFLRIEKLHVIGIPH